MRMRGWYSKSKQEDDLYKKLCNHYSSVLRWYKDVDRYPFFCDFYIPSEDLFIEYNGWWHHGPKPYDENDIESRLLLSSWEEKSIDNKQYKKAMYIWTERDVQKIQCMKDNQLNYVVIYPNFIFANK